MSFRIPSHLKKYIVPQNYQKYTEEDQAVWHYLMKRIGDLQSRYGHSMCLKGMQKTGITFDRIPKISQIDKKLQSFGWRAVSVSGFLPPRAFMDFQSHGILPIASELRTVNHIHYTPAPDIVHEAAGHAPFLIHPVFSRFLKEYAQVVKKAIVNWQDMKKYEAIRQLSDMKENPSSSQKDIQKAEKHLLYLQRHLKTESESSRLSRFIWWTSEYGLIGSLKTAKIYGAGLISSIEEAKKCFHTGVKKIPLTVDCLNYPYDITRFQPQLFVTPNFEHLLVVLQEIAGHLAWQKGGLYGIREALKSRTLNTVELTGGLQISGVLEKAVSYRKEICFLKFAGPSQLSFKDKEIKGQGKNRHAEGYSTPLNPVEIPKNLHAGQILNLHFPKEIELKGQVEKVISKQGRPIVITFKNCSVCRGGEILYAPQWGPFDLLVASGRVVSVFSGPADEKAFGLEDSFKPSVVEKKSWTEKEKAKFKAYRVVSQLESKKYKSKKTLTQLVSLWQSRFPKEWLLGLEILKQSSSWQQTRKIINAHLNGLKKSHPHLRSLIQEGRSFYTS